MCARTSASRSSARITRAPRSGATSGRPHGCCGSTICWSAGSAASPAATGSAPSMSFLGLRASPRRGDRSIAVDGVPVEMPEMLEDRPEGKFALGVRPENVSFADASRLRGQVIGAEYLGTTQIVTVTTASGQIKARLPSGKAVHVGESVGLALRPDRLSLFDAVSGQALQSALYAGGQHG